jgi:hypothetical protein
MQRIAQIEIGRGLRSVALQNNFLCAGDCGRGEQARQNTS